MHPARVRLNLYGVSVSDVGRLAGISTSAASQQLAGHTRISEAVRSALLELLNPEQVAEVLSAIPSREELAA